MRVGRRDLKQNMKQEFERYFANKISKSRLEGGGGGGWRNTKVQTATKVYYLKRQATVRTTRPWHSRSSLHGVFVTYIL